MWEILLLLLFYILVILLFYILLQKTVQEQRTTDHVDRIQSPEENNKRTTIRKTEVSPEVPHQRDEAVQTEVSPEVWNRRDEAVQTEVSPEVWNRRDEAVQTEASPEISNRRAEIDHIVTKSPKLKKKRGKVPDLEYNILREHRVEMVEKLLPKKLIPHLLKNKVIDYEDVEMIEKKCKDLRRKGAETMLNILYESGSWAFMKLIAALQQAQYHQLAQKLTEDIEKKKNDPSSVTTTKQRGRLSGVELEALRDNHERLVNELDSSILKNHLFQNNLIDAKDLRKITKKEEELREEGVEEMLTIIYNSGQEAFDGLVKSLAEAGYDELSKDLSLSLEQKKKETAKVGLKIDSIDFPDYKQGGGLWCKIMNSWFKNHTFQSKAELKLVVKKWLGKLEEVFNSECLEDDISIRLMAPFVSSYTDDEIQLKMKQQLRFFQILKQNLEGIVEGKRNLTSIPINLETCIFAYHFPSVVDDVKEIWYRLP